MHTIYTTYALETECLYNHLSVICKHIVCFFFMFVVLKYLRTLCIAKVGHGDFEYAYTNEHIARKKQNLCSNCLNNKQFYMCAATHLRNKYETIKFQVVYGFS